MALTLSQIEWRIRHGWYHNPKYSWIQLTDQLGFSLCNQAMMRKIINQSVQEWAMENLLDEQRWTLDDGAGGEGKTTIGQRRYALPNDVLVLTHVKLGYDDTSGFEGYPLELVDNFDLVKNPYSTTLETTRPERLYVFRDVFDLDPIPQDTYTMRFWGYHLPSALTGANDAPDTLHLYHENIFDFAKIKVAEHISDIDINAKKIVYMESKKRAREFRDRLKNTVDIVSGQNGYW